MQDFILYYSFLLLILSAFFGIGYGILRLLKLDYEGYEQLFWSLFAGVITVTVGVAIIRTGGKSVMTAVPLGGLLAWGLGIFKQDKSIETIQTSIFTDNKPSWLQKITVIGLASLLFFSLKFYFVREDGHFILPFIDDRFYAKIAHSLVAYGTESTNMWHYLDVQNSSLEPYHYFELWLTGIIAWVTYQPTVIVINLILDAIFYINIVLGLLHLLTKKYNHYYFVFAVSIFLPFISGFYPVFTKLYPFFDSIQATAYLGTYAKILNMHKVLPIMLLLLCFYICVYEKKIQKGLTFLLLLPIFSILTYPSVMLACIGYETIVSIHRRLKKIEWHISFLAVILSLFIILFYVVGNVDNLSQSAGSLSNHLSIFVKGIKSLIVILLTNLYVYLPIVFVFLFLCYTNYQVWREQQKTFLIYALLLVGGAVAWILLIHNYNSKQFFYLIFFSLHFLLVLKLFMFTSQQKMVYWLLSVIIIAFLSSIYCTQLYFNEHFSIIESKVNYTFLKKVQAVISNSQSKNKNFAVISPEKNIMMYHGEYITLLNSDYKNSQLGDNIIDTTNCAVYEKVYILKLPFYKYIKAKQLLNPDLTLPQLRYSFMKENKIEYLCTTLQTTLDSTLQKYVKLAIDDSIYQQRFIQLNPLP